MLKSRTTTEPNYAGLLPVITPGEILLEEFMKPLGLTISALAHALDVPPIRISQIVHGQRAITADTALRLELYFGCSASMWLGIQKDYEMRLARRKSGARLKATIKPAPHLHTRQTISRKVLSSTKTAKNKVA